MKRMIAFAVLLALVVPAVARVVSPQKPRTVEEFCDTRSRIEAVSDKGKAVVEYCEARARLRAARGVSGIYAIGAMLAGHAPAMNEAVEAYENARGAMFAARAKAQDAGGIKLEGAGEDDAATVTLEKGVDYRPL